MIEVDHDLNQHLNVIRRVTRCLLE
jgi:hypothetical protein